MYELNQYCTPEGGQGSGWPWWSGPISSYKGTNGKSALEACCACGGGRSFYRRPPTMHPTPSPTKSPTSSPTPSPTSSPTSSPTASPTRSPTTPAAGSPVASANAAVSATGDPHMQNILGQRFDLMQPGKHTLLQIPRVASDSDTLLRVMADAEHEGGACADMYFKALNITGEWVSAHQKDGYMYTADAPQTVASWRTFGKVEVKVAWGRTLEGVEYLNFLVRHLKRVGHDIGGLLGMDDYRQAAKPTALCDSIEQLFLGSEASIGAAASQQASFA